MARTAGVDRLYSAPALLIVRVLVGALFVFSGFVKGVDPWGLVIKMGEYLAVWRVDVPGALVTFASFFLSAFEFVWGALLLLGCYRRFSVWMLSLCMAFMLPLSAWLMFADPVSDCGCFGDFLHISNTATFLKNLAITLGLVYLWLFNSRVQGLFGGYIHWIVGGLLTFYILSIELFGYNIQPMQDYRRFAPGVSLLADSADDGSAPLTYIYERDGERREFTIDSLPDSTWTFVERVEADIPGTGDVEEPLAVLDAGGEDILEDVIDSSTPQFIVTIPDLRRADLSCTYLINELNDFITPRGGSLVALIGSGEKGVEWWTDISMASYPVYRADPSRLRELARGNVALVYLDKGVVKWKRAVTSISYTLVTETPSHLLIDTIDPHCSYWLWMLTAGLCVILIVLFLLDRSGRLIHLHFFVRRHRRPSDSTAEAPSKSSAISNPE